MSQRIALRRMKLRQRTELFSPELCECSTASKDAEWGMHGHRIIRSKSLKAALANRPSLQSARKQILVRKITRRRFLNDYSDSEQLSDEFDRLAERWERETENISSPTEMAEHAAYQQIIAMGEDAIPLILQRMSDRGGHWFWALSILANVDPVPAAKKGNIAEMSSAWLKWGYEHGHC